MENKVKPVFRAVLMLLLVLSAAAASANRFEESFGDGRDGDLAVGPEYTAAAPYIMNTIKTYTLGDNLAGERILQVDNALGFNPGDEILIMTMQDFTTTTLSKSEAGCYETKRIESIEMNSTETYFVLTAPLEQSFTRSWHDNIAKKNQVIRIPNYRNVTVEGYTTAPAWDGITGGVMIFRASGKFWAKSQQIEMSARGYRGSRVPNWNGPGYTGEGIMNVPNSSSAQNSLDNSGGAGQNFYGTLGYGGSGGHKTAATTSGVNQYCGKGGLAVGNDNMDRILMGAGGGSSGSKGYNESVHGIPSGGNGGGIIMIAATHIMVNDGDSTITAKGNKGNSYVCTYYTTCGCGAGGSIYLAAYKFDVAAHSINVNGGPYCNYNSEGAMGRSRLLTRIGVDHSPTALDFGEWHTGMGATPAKTVTITNLGTQDLVINSIALSGTAMKEFKLASPTLPLTIGSGATYVLPVTFDPSTPGLKTAALTILNNSDNCPTINIPLNGIGYSGLIKWSASNPAAGAESSGPVLLTLNLTAPSVRPISVNLSVRGTAASGSDFAPISAGTLLFAPGETEKTITLDVKNDALDELDETVILTLSGAVGVPAPSPATFIYTIRDDDATPTVSFSLPASFGPESITRAYLEVLLSAPSGLTVTVGCAPTGGSATADVDYKLLPQTLRFLPGETRKLVALTVLRDAFSEPDETVQVSLSAPVNAILGSTTVHTYTITDSPALPTAQFTMNASPESVRYGTIVVTLSQVPPQPVKLRYAVTGGTATRGSDYLLPDGELTFAAGEQMQVIVFEVVDDAIYEGDENFTVALFSADGGVWPVGVGQPNTFTYTILENDAKPTVQFKAAASMVLENQAATVEVQLTGATSKTTTVNWATANGTAMADTDYSGASGTVTFKPGESKKTITVNVISDDQPETDETFTIKLSAAVAANLGDLEMHTVTIRDDD